MKPDFSEAEVFLGRKCNNPDTYKRVMADDDAAFDKSLLRFPINHITAAERKMLKRLAEKYRELSFLEDLPVLAKYNIEIPETLVFQIENELYKKRRSKNPDLTALLRFYRKRWRETVIYRSLNPQYRGSGISMMDEYDPNGPFRHYVIEYSCKKR